MDDSCATSPVPDGCPLARLPPGFCQSRLRVFPYPAPSSRADCPARRAGIDRFRVPRIIGHRGRGYGENHSLMCIGKLITRRLWRSVAMDATPPHGEFSA